MLACNIRANPRIIGLSLPGSMSPLPVISQYADDTSLVVTSDDSFTATFDTYSLFEKGSGAKLNQSKSKGLWLGSLVGRTNPPVVLDWSPSKLKILGVYLGRGDLEEANWRLRIDAVENVLLSWRQRSLSFQGRSLVINVLALARIWYVASLIHMPLWVLKELNSLVFNFFWRGKRELVAHSSVVQPPRFGGFAVIDVKRKVQSLVVQWIKRFASSPACWTSFMEFWFRSRLNLSPLEALSYPYSVSVRYLPLFYQSLILAWRAVDGSYSVARSSLVMVSGHSFVTASGMSAKSCYVYLLSECYSPPHCALKFSHRFGGLYWSTTWRQLSQSLMFRSSPRCPTLSCRHVFFGFDEDELCIVPNVFVYMLNVCKYFIWHARNDFRFRGIQPGAIVVIEQVKSRVRFHLAASSVQEI